MTYNTQITYTGNGTQTDYSIPFSYDSLTEVKVVRLDTGASLSFTIPIVGICRLSSAPANGVKFVVYRDTDVTNPSIVWQPNASIRSTLLNSMTDQFLRVMQEVKDYAASTFASFRSVEADIATLQTNLGAIVAGGVAAAPEVIANVTSSPYSVGLTETFLKCNFAGTLVINLPTAVSRNNLRLTVKDASQAAGTNHIIINARGTDTIDGNASDTIAANSASRTYIPDATEWFRA